MADLCQELFAEMASFVRLSGARESACSLDVAEATLLKLEFYIHILCVLMASLTGKLNSEPPPPDSR